MSLNASQASFYSCGIAPNDVLKVFFPIVSGSLSGLINYENLQIEGRSVLSIFVAVQMKIGADVVGICDTLPPFAKGAHLKAHSFAGDSN